MGDSVQYGMFVLGTNLLKIFTQLREKTFPKVQKPSQNFPDKMDTFTWKNSMFQGTGFVKHFINIGDVNWDELAAGFILSWRMWNQHSSEPNKTKFKDKIQVHKKSLAKGLYH